ncbi:MAG: LysR family transcriptional regulator [Steroidobacteraceae bacterium]
MNQVTVHMYRKRSQTTGSTTMDLQDISLRALQVFAAVDEAGSLAEAATRLGGSRSSVSQHITNLEKLVGAALFDRTARPISLTPVGQIMRRHAYRILSAVSEARTELMGLSLVSLIELRLGIIDDLDASVAPDVVRHVRERYPRCQLTVTSGRSDALNEDLTHRRVDLVLTGISAGPDSVYQEYPIVREPFMLVAPKGVFSMDRELRPQMEQQPFIRYNANMPIGQIISQHLRRLKIDLPAPFSFDASRSVFSMMLKSRGWTITTPLCLMDSGQDAERMDCFRLPFFGLERTIRIITRREELGLLPQHLAEVTRNLIRTDVLPKLIELAPWLAQEFTLLGNAGETIAAHASVRAADGS